MIKRGYRELRTHIDDIFLEEDCKTVDRAFKFASEKLEGVTLPDGQPTLEHSIGVAVIAAKEMGLAVHSVVSAILHNIPFVDEIPDSSDGSDVADGFEDFNGNDNYVTYATLEELFGKTVRDILEGLQKINSIDKETLALHSENFRRLLLTLSGDVRVILIKLADQLQDMRNLQFFDGERKISFVSETEHLYAPFAHRLGLYKINSELQDIVLSVQHSEEYNIIKTKLEESNEFRHNFTTQFVKPIEEKLEAAGWKFTIKARTKSIYSIWNKMKSNQIDFTDVHDIFAIRVILETAPTHEKEKADCWQIFPIVTEQYKSNPNRHRDWLSIRKSNGYESLHNRARAI